MRVRSTLQALLLGVREKNLARSRRSTTPLSSRDLAVVPTAFGWALGIEAVQYADQLVHLL